jgi:hypothetical protein
MIINPYLVQPSIPAFTGLLDTYTGAAAAYSAARRLATAYTGSLIRVRRSSDNAEQDIGYTAGNVLDESALTTFVGAGDGFVTTWYDQSGNSINFENSIAANQPQIVSSGSVITQNSKPALLTDGINDSLVNLLNIAGGNTLCSFYTVSQIGSGTNDGYRPTMGIWAGIADIGSLHYIKSTNNGASYPFYNNFSFADPGTFTYSNNTMYLISAMFKGSSPWQISTNGTVDLSNATYGTFNSIQLGFVLGFQRSPLRYSNNKYSEVIFYTTNQTTNKLGIETNINTFYSIY